MRSLSEIYSIVKQFHRLFNPSFNNFMCIAASCAWELGHITREEHEAVRSDIMKLVRSIDEFSCTMHTAVEQKYFRTYKHGPEEDHESTMEKLVVAAWEAHWEALDKDANTPTPV